VLAGAGFAAMFFPGEGDELAAYALGAVIGIGNGTGLVMAASIQADIVDSDEHATGERREGMYFAVWNFVRKSASGLMGFLAGVGLQVVGFVPNAEQPEGVSVMIRGLISLLPAAAFALGLVLFLRFRLTEAEHRRIRAELEQRV
jgi:GPH family glycoside/pentoside/hexuronide:cation symporter